MAEKAGLTSSFYCLIIFSESTPGVSSLAHFVLRKNLGSTWALTAHRDTAVPAVRPVTPGSCRCSLEHPESFPKTVLSITAQEVIPRATDLRLPAKNVVELDVRNTLGFRSLLESLNNGNTLQAAMEILALRIRGPEWDTCMSSCWNSANEFKYQKHHQRKKSNSSKV